MVEPPLARHRGGIQPPGWDAFLLAVLVFATLQISGLAESAVLPNRLDDVLRHPILGNLLPPAGEQAMGEIGPRPGEPIGLILNATTIAFLLLYFVTDLTSLRKWKQRLKWLLLTGILLTALFLPTAKLILLRQQSGPASYTHDGGVIQTEVTIQYLLSGKNPYSEDYVDTPMAEWGFSQYRTALYHYPYLPWTFLFSAPFYLVGQAFGFYDQRLVYLLVLALALLLTPTLVRDARGRLALVACLGLNPVMALDVNFGQNDVFVLSWLIFSLVAWRHWQQCWLAGRRCSWMLLASTIFFGLACASKPTAWFFAPFYGLLLVWDQVGAMAVSWSNLVRVIPAIIKRIWPALAVLMLILLPYLLWDPFAFYDDVWRWSAGQGDTGYQIWGWGSSNFILALGLVAHRFAQWPFWMLEIVLALPLLIWFLRRQQTDSTLYNACWHYAIFLLAFFYGSRFLNENYLGYILAFLAIGSITYLDSDAPNLDESAPNTSLVRESSG